MYVKVPIVVSAAGEAYDPTADDVSMAFLAEGTDPISGDWKTASWEIATSPGGVTVYLARIIVGPGGSLTLAKGKYRIWVKIVDSPETPVLTSDVLIVT